MSGERRRRTKIVATIGPASDDPETLARLVDAGLDVARLNFAHGTPESQAATAERVRDAAGRAGRQVAILQDLSGPKIRTGLLRNGEPILLKPGDELRIAFLDLDVAIVVALGLQVVRSRLCGLCLGG